MCEDEVWVAGEEVDFVAFGEADEDEGDFARRRVVHFGFGELLVTFDFVWLVKCGDHVYKEQVCVFGGVQSLFPIRESQHFV